MSRDTKVIEADIARLEKQSAQYAKDHRTQLGLYEKNKGQMYKVHASKILDLKAQVDKRIVEFRAELAKAKSKSKEA